MKAIKQTITALLCSCCVVTAAANPDVNNCITIESDRQRLNCYDELFLPAIISPPTPEEALQSEIEEFGIEHAKQARREQSPELDEITATVEKISQRPRNELVFTLSNGQVWTQTRPRLMDVDKGVAVVIRRAGLGGYILTTERGASTRVKRLQ
jgi:hypothetical protein